MELWCREDLGKSPGKILRRRKAGLKTGKFGGGFGRRLQKDGQRAMPQLTPNVPEYAKNVSVEFFEINGIDEKNRRKRRNRRKEIDEIDEKKRRKRRNRRKKSTKTTKSTKQNDEIDEKMGCYAGLIFVVFVRQFRRFRQIFSSISSIFFRQFRRFRRFRKVWGGGGVIFVAPFSVTFSGPPCEGGRGGWGSGFGVRGVGTVAGGQCAATKTPRKDNTQGRFCEGFALGAPFPALSQAVGLAPVDFCNAGVKKNFLNNWKNLNSVRPFITRILIRGSGWNRRLFLFGGGGVVGTPLFPLRTHTRLT